MAECKHKWVLIAQQMQCEYCGKIYEIKQGGRFENDTRTTNTMVYNKAILYKIIQIKDE